jgi:hypothetical protein
MNCFICFFFNVSVGKPDCIVLNAWITVSREMEGIWKVAVMGMEGSSALMYHPRNCLDELRKPKKKSPRTKSKPKFKPNTSNVPVRSVST